MELRDLKAQYQALKTELDAAIAKAVGECSFIGGQQVEELEHALAQYVEVRHCITCANGTDALSLVLMAWGIGAGDAVFVPDFTFFATGEAVALAGAEPIFVDVDEDTFNMDAHALEKSVQTVLQEGRLTPRAVIPVDLFGLPANYPAIEDIAARYHLRVLEDGAQGLGGSLGGRMSCSFGSAAITSFFPAKPLGCYGDGGAIFTSDDDLAALLRSLCVHGKGAHKYDNLRIGRNSRLDTLQAAILLVKLRAFRRYELERVNQLAHRYGTRLLGAVKPPVIPQGATSSRAQYTITLPDEVSRDRVKGVLEGKGIASGIYYPTPLSGQRAFAPFVLRSNPRSPVAERLCRQVLSLPMHPYLTEEEVDAVAAAVTGALNEAGENTVNHQNAHKNHPPIFLS